jgi:hypothetical protein|tara:strand:- start:170 stop:355 length:186 start_codon:yes stop_codon:yes gene_type:complete
MAMLLKNSAIGLNILLLFLFVGYFIGHGFPESLILWSSATLWLIAPLINLLYIKKNNLRKN